MRFYRLQNFSQRGASCQLPPTPPLLVLSFVLTREHTLGGAPVHGGQPALQTFPSGALPGSSSPSPQHLPAHALLQDHMGEDRSSELPSATRCLPRSGIWLPSLQACALFPSDVRGPGASLRLRDGTGKAEREGGERGRKVTWGWKGQGRSNKTHLLGAQAGVLTQRPPTAAPWPFFRVDPSEAAVGPRGLAGCRGAG